jgi:hypothetical protein
VRSPEVLKDAERHAEEKSATSANRAINFASPIHQFIRRKTAACRFSTLNPVYARIVLEENSYFVLQSTSKIARCDVSNISELDY